MQRTLHELRIFQIELEMQNEELLRNQHELESSRERYFDMYDLAPFSYLTLNEQGLILETNLSAAAMLGVDRRTLLNQPLSRYIHPDDHAILYLHCKQLSKSDSSKTCEIRILKMDGTQFWARIQTEPWQEKDSGKTVFRTIFSNITEHRQAEETLKNSEKQYRTILHTLLDGFWVVDMLGRFIDVNEAYCNIIGYTRNELLEMSIQDIEALENKEDIEHRINNITKKGTHRFESQHRCKNGYIVDLDICVSSLPDYNRLCASLRDITERKRAEGLLRKAHDELELRVAERTSELAHAIKQIRESEERHQLATSIAKEAIWEVDFSTGTTRWNRAYTEIFNRPPDEHHHGEWWLQQIHPDDRERVNDKFSRTVSEGPDEWADNYRMMRADGRYAYLQDRAIVVRDGTGKALRAVGAKLDVTERVEAEEELTRSEARLQFALETSRTGAWDLDLTDLTSIRSLEHDRIFGYPELLPEWTYEKFLEHVLPEDRAAVDGTIQRTLENRSDLNFECRIRRTDGQVRQIFAAGRHRKDSTGAPLRMSGIIQDITERKLVEEEIRNLNTKLEKRVAERTADLAIANEQLRLANEEWLNTFNSSTDPIMILDRDCRIRRANHAMAALLGMQIEECAGKFCYEQLHHTDAPAPLCPHNQMLQDGRSHTAEIFVEHIGKHLLVTVSPLLDSNGSLTGSMHYTKDISTLKEAEQVLANAKSELERKVTERTVELALAHEEMKKVSFELIWAEEKERERIAAELHDQVGQSLLLAKMKLDALEDKLSDDSLLTYAVEAASLIDTSIQDIRSLTFRMRPPILDTAGIATSLEWLCSSISHDYNLQVDFADDGHPKPLSVEMRYSLYQAVRELLLNVVKHAGTETAQLSITTDNHTLVVHVADNGVGFSHPDAILKHVNNGGYGLYNVKQRIEQMGGRFAVESTPGTGTSVTLRVPFY
jgi:PAS domain S-box-containing protein